MPGIAVAPKPGASSASAKRFIIHFPESHDIYRNAEGVLLATHEHAGRRHHLLAAVVAHRAVFSPKRAPHRAGRLPTRSEVCHARMVAAHPDPVASQKIRIVADIDWLAPIAGQSQPALGDQRAHDLGATAGDGVGPRIQPLVLPAPAIQRVGIVLDK